MSRLYKKDDDVIVTNDSLHKVYSKIVNTVEGLTVEVQESGGSLMIIVRGDENFEGCDITALCKLDNREYTKTLVNGTAVLKVKLPGEYFITNTHSDATITCYVGEPFIDEVYFTDFYGSINVTVPELLIGETLEAKNGEHTVEKEIKSIVEVLDVFEQGTWSVGIKGTEFITPQEATLQEMGESKTVQLTLDGAAYITVTLADEIKDERITCKNNEEFTRIKTPIDGKVQFFVPTLANYTVCLELSDLIKKEVNVEAQQEYEVTLDLEDLSVPVLLVTSKPENNGKIIKVSRADKTLERELRNEKALYIIEETGEYTITCDELPDKTRTVQIKENKLYKVRLGGFIYGIRVKQSEPDPQKRIEVLPDTDLYGLKPITVNKEIDAIDYGDMESTLIFQAMNHVVLLDNSTGEEIELNPNDYSQKLDGSPAPEAGLNTNYNTFARVDKLYLYMHNDGDYEYYYLSEDKEDNNYTAVGFTREDESEADSFYVGTYSGWYDDSNKLRSVANTKIRNYTGHTQFCEAARKNGDGYSIDQFQMHVFHQIAFLMMAQTFDCETLMGKGRSFGFYSLPNTIDADTGFANNKGPIALGSADKLDCKGVKFMHVEDIWVSGGYHCEEGLMYQDKKTYVRIKPPYVTTESGGTSTYTSVIGAGEKGGFASKSMISNIYGRIPTEANGSRHTYECSNWNPGSGSYLSPSVKGVETIFGTNCGNPFNQGQNPYLGARLCYLPPKKD